MAPAESTDNTIRNSSKIDDTCISDGDCDLDSFHKPLFKRHSRGLNEESDGPKLSNLSALIRRSFRITSNNSYAKKAAKKATEIRWDIDRIKYWVKSNQHKQVKKYIRRNHWPHDHGIRRLLWTLLCETKDFDSAKNFYLSQIQELGLEADETESIFLKRDDLNIVTNFGLNDSSILAVRRQLLVIEYSRPDIHYMANIQPVCAIFMHYLEERDSYACISHLLGQRSRFFLQSEISVVASVHTLVVLLRKHRKRIFKALQDEVGHQKKHEINRPGLEQLLKNFYKWIFKFPFPYLVRIMDCFIVEGHKFLLRIAIALLIIWFSTKGNRFRKSSSKIKRQRLSFRQYNRSSDEQGDGSGTGLCELDGAQKGVPCKSFLVSESRKSQQNNFQRSIAKVDQQICEIASNCPASVEQLFDLAFSIRNFKSSSINRHQKHFENEQLRGTPSATFLLYPDPTQQRHLSQSDSNNSTYFQQQKICSSTTQHQYSFDNGSKSLFQSQPSFHVHQPFAAATQPAQLLPPFPQRTITNRRLLTPVFQSNILRREIARELMYMLPARFQLETPQLVFRLSEHGTSFLSFWEKVDRVEQTILVLRSVKGDIFGAYLSTSWKERRDSERRATRFFGTGESFVWKIDPGSRTFMPFRWFSFNSLQQNQQQQQLKSPPLVATENDPNNNNNNNNTIEAVEATPLLFCQQQQEQMDQEKLSPKAVGAELEFGIGMPSKEMPQMFMAAGDRFLIIGSGGGDAISIYDELTRGCSWPCDTFGSPALVIGNDFEIDELEAFAILTNSIE